MSCSGPQCPPPPLHPFLSLARHSLPLPVFRHVLPTHCPSVPCPLSQSPLSSWSSIPGWSALPSFTSRIITAVPLCSSRPPLFFITLLAIPRPSLAIPRGIPSPLQTPNPPLPGFLGPKSISTSLPSPGLETRPLTAF